MPEHKLTTEQCQEIGRRIIDIFYRLAAGGTAYGCDWPTMRMLWPAKCRVFTRLKARYHSAKETPNGQNVPNGKRA